MDVLSQYNGRTTTGDTQENKHMSNPIVDQLSRAFVDQLSFETKMGMYKDVKDANPDFVSTAMCSVSIEAAIDEFVFQMVWHLQHRLLNQVLSEEEIDERIG